MSELAEIWSDVVIDNITYPYKISNCGRILINKTNKIAKPSLDSNGYPQIALVGHGKRITRKIHILVATAFVGGKCERKQVNHKDGDKLNANYLNLEWVTAKENKRHSIEMGLWKPYNSFNHPQRIKVIDRKTGIIYPSISYAERKLGIGHIHHMLNGERKNTTNIEYYYGH